MPGIRRPRPKATPKVIDLAIAIASKEPPREEQRHECFATIAIACSPSTALPIAVESGHRVGLTPLGVKQPHLPRHSAQIPLALFGQAPWRRR